MTPYIYPGIKRPAKEFNEGSITKEALYYIHEVCRLYGCTTHEIVAFDRHKNIAEARHVAVALVRACGYTLIDTGIVFNRDHATIRHSVQVVKDLLVIDRQFRSKLNRNVVISEKLKLLNG